MEKILSQEEIDALLKGIEDGKVDAVPAAEARAGEGNLFAYDFKNQDRNIRGRMPTLELINASFARALRNPLAIVLRKNVKLFPRESC